MFHPPNYSGVSRGNSAPLFKQGYEEHQMSATRIGSEILVNTATSNLQSEQRITTLGNGGFVVVWKDDSLGVGGAGGDTSWGAIKAQVFAANGARVGSEILVNTATYQMQDLPTITTLNNGGFVVAWEDWGGDSNWLAIKAQVFTPSGGRVGSEIFVNTATDRGQADPTITALNNGGFVVAWEDWSGGIGGAGGDTSWIAIKTQVFAANGARVGSEILVNTATYSDQYLPTITALNNGGFVVAWADRSEGVGGAGGDSSGEAIKAQIFTANGGRVGSEILVNTTTYSAQQFPIITALNNGGFVVTWEDLSQGVFGSGSDASMGAIKAQVFATNGGKVGGEILVNTATNSWKKEATITALNNGGFVVAWEDDSQGVGGAGGDSSNFAIKAQVFDADGTRLGGEILVNTTTDRSQLDPTIAALGNGGFVVSWEDWGFHTGAVVIKAQVFAFDGDRVGNEILVNTTTEGHQFNPTITALDNDSFVVAWIGNDDIRAQVFTIINEQTGTASADTLTGTNGADLIYGMGGDDTLDGGEGTDSAVVRGLVSQYTLSSQGASYVLDGPDGTDTLTSIEYVRFGEDIGQDWAITNVALGDVGNGSADHLMEQITDLYVAYFNRAPDSEGLAYWFKTIYTGEYSLRTIAERFTFEQEYLDAYPSGLVNRNFVEQIYLNLFDRNPDSGGWDWWTNELDTGHRQRSGFILDVIEGAYAPTSGPEDRTLIDNKHDVSLYYSERLSLQPEEGFDSTIATVLNRVTGEVNTVPAAARVIDYAFDNPTTLAQIVGNAALFDSLWAG
jgi:uncharacterized protein YebE (UPF0316 family)